jgi:transcriptional regulator with XRE-family HTH domain
MDGRRLLVNFIEGRTTQAEFARVIRCSEPHLSLILKGDRRPSLDLAKRINDATGGAVPIDAFAVEAAP